jgi:7-cyano-7-deazaguanine synthase in queuosine biosynthesis
MVESERLAFGIESDENLVHWQAHYRLDDEPIAAGLARQVEPVFADLLDLAVAVYVTDRLTPRRPKYKTKDGTHWRRNLRLRIAVREHRFWTDSANSELVHQLLGWLTDDSWDIEFVPGPALRRHSETQGRLFVDPPQSPTQVVLFSGGLDSLLGAAGDAVSSDGELILVSAGTHPRMKGKQAELAAGLRELTPRRLRQVIVPVGLTEAGKSRVADRRGEESQRTRGFVFLSFGTAVANAAGCDELRVHENGPGALNLPLTPGQQGSMNTRAARPETLQMMSTLISRLAGRPFTIRNPAFWSTKAEMCRAASDTLAALISSSVSCDTGLTRRTATEPLCGVCTSCLLRRQALLAAGLTEIDDGDLQKMPGDGLAAARANARPEILAMMQQAREIESALANNDPWFALLARFPELGKARRALGAEPQHFVDLLGRYVEDWRKVGYPLSSEFLSDEHASARLTPA